MVNEQALLISFSYLYLLFFTAACCSPDGNEFAVLALLSSGETSTEQDGAILLFDAESPNPVASWSVKKVCLFVLFTCYASLVWNIVLSSVL